MKKLYPCLLLALLAGCTTTPPEPAGNQDVTAELKPLVEKVLAGWATMDTKNVEAFYAKDAGLTYFDIAPLKYTGWAEYAKGFQQASSEWKSLKISVGEFQATRHGNIAWAVYTTPLELEPKAGPVLKATARGTDVLEKRGADWIIIHEHVSVPLPEPPPPPAADSKKKK